jgi:glutathione S-transferase
MSVWPEIMLYHSPGSRSDRVKMLLELIGRPYGETLIDTGAQEHKTPKYLRINPLGLIPGLTIDGAPMAESVAQMLYLADLDPDRRFTPPDGAEARIRYLQWMIMIPASLEPPVIPLFRPGDDTAAREAAVDGLRLQAEMFVGPYCLGDQLTALDVLLHWNLSHMRHLGLLETFDIWRAYLERLEPYIDWAGLNAVDA